MNRRAFIRATTSAAALVGLVALSACTGIHDVKPPQVALQDVRPVGGGLFAQEVAIDLRLTNPNDVDLPLDGLSTELRLNDAPFAQGVSDTSITIPRLSSRTVRVSATVSTLDLARQLFNLGRTQRLDYSISGTAYLAGGIGRRSVDFAQSGTLDVTPRSDAPGHRLVPIAR